MPGNGMMPVGRLTTLCNGVNERPAGLSCSSTSKFGSSAGVTGVGKPAGLAGFSAGETGFIKARNRSISAACSKFCFAVSAGVSNALAHRESGL